MKYAKMPSIDSTKIWIYGHNRKVFVVLMQQILIQENKHIGKVFF
jgi:hypothetical protein